MGKFPPSPGLAPWATLIWISSALFKYSIVTPKRPEATCLILLFWSVSYREGSSPPSPQLDIPLILFIALASVSCASLEIAPKLIAPTEKRFTISDAGSTSLIEIEFFPSSLNKLCKLNILLFICFEYSLNNS